MYCGASVPPLPHQSQIQIEKNPRLKTVYNPNARAAFSPEKPHNFHIKILVRYAIDWSPLLIILLGLLLLNTII